MPTASTIIAAALQPASVEIAATARRTGSSPTRGAPGDAWAEAPGASAVASGAAASRALTRPRGALSSRACPSGTSSTNAL